MTRNNLANHLAWLLSHAELSRPTGPVLPSVSSDPIASSRSSFVSSQQTLVPGLSQNQSACPPPRAQPVNLAFDSDDELELAAIDDDTVIPAEEEVEQLGTRTRIGTSASMARLTAKPTSKPSLMCKQTQLPTPSTTGTTKLQKAYSESLQKEGSSRSKLQQAYSASLNTQNQALKQTPSSPTVKSGKSSAPSWSSTFKKPEPRQRSVQTPDDEDEQMHDLTGEDLADADVTALTEYGFGTPIPLWTEEHARRREPPTSRGKKRKSSEIARSSPVRKVKQAPKQDIKEEDDEFPDIYDLVDEDIMTPAMVKRRNAGLSSSRKSPVKPHVSATDTTVLTQRTVTQTVSTTETTIHRTGSMDRTPPRGTSRGAKSPSGKDKTVALPPASSLSRAMASSPSRKQHTTRRSSSLIISDDDIICDDGALTGRNSTPKPNRTRRFQRSDVIRDSDDDSDTFETPPTRKTSNISFMAATTGTDSGAKDNHVSPGPVSKEMPSEDHVAALDRRRARASSHESGRFDDQMDLDDAQESSEPQNAETRDERDSQQSDGGTLIMDLFKIQPHILDVLAEENRQKRDENSLELNRALREKWPVERRARIKQDKEPLKKQKEALSAAKLAHDAYNELDAKREELLAQITILYDADKEIEAAEAELESLSKEIEDQESVLKKALVEAGVTVEAFRDLPDPPVQKHPAHQGPQAVASQSMSARPPPSMSRESSFIPECASQNVQHSQTSFSKLPSQMVDFEELPASSKSRPSVPSFPRIPQDPVRTEKKTTAPISLPPRRQAHITEDLFDDDDDEDHEIWNQAEVYQPKSKSLHSASKTVASTRTRSPVKSRPRPADNFSDYGEDDVEAMVAMAEEAEDFGRAQSFVGARQERRDRTVLSESSGNALAPAARVRAQAPMPAKPVPKIRIDPKLMQHPWSKDVLRAFKDRFRLEGFRHNQLEAINATLAGEDAFVLMPTGGGKSLCYQLPAVINSGKTRGVTIVVTPLLSLMQDQVDHLTARGIIAKAFNGEMDRAEKQNILESFKKKNPEHHVQLLYVTPEMISKSTAFLNGLRALHRNRKFARLVIDEAHCVSQWGHDFRPDYKELGHVRKEFPGVPVIALTATATNNVLVDVQHNLDIENCKVFTQSFNRPNLYYEVQQKQRQSVEHIAKLINERYKGQTGIVYTLSRKQTETIASKLRDQGIQAAHYHAGMTQDKIQVQRDWQSGRIKVVVATIAFGMGIDKADVRFVIHQYLPKSLEGYYQETGRAGRDGLHSDCYLFFGHGDIHQLKRFIDDSDGSPAQKERQKEMLNRVVMFCENTRDCRRIQLLDYFGDAFTKQECGGTCDNCKNDDHHEVEDVTKYAKAVLQAVMYHTRLTMIQCTEILQGKKKDKDDEHQPFHGIAKDMNRYEISRIIARLAFDKALGEENRVGGGGIAIQYFILGPEAASFLSGGHSMKLVVRQGGNKDSSTKTTKKRTRKKATGEEQEDSRPVSTCISSPVRVGSRKSKKAKSVQQFFDEEALVEGDESDDVDLLVPRHANGYEQDGFVVDDDDEDDEDYFDAPVAPPPERRRQKTLDGMISRNAVKEPVSEVHGYVVANFVTMAKELEENTRNNKGLRQPLFTESQLQQMAINWTDTLDKMRRIPGIDTDKVKKYGSEFAKLVKDCHKQYLEMENPEDESMATIPATAGPSSSRRGPPLGSGDVIDLLSESDDDDYDFEDAGVSSKYFEDPVQAELEASKRRMEATSRLSDEPASRGRNSASRRSSQGGGGGRRNYYRKGGGGSRGSSKYGGVGKRKGSSSAAGGNRRTSAGSAKSGGARSTASTAKKSGGSGIGVMPF